MKIKKEFRITDLVNTKRYIFLILFYVICHGCGKDWLNLKPDKNLVTPTTLFDFELLLDNVNIMNEQAIGLGEVASDGHYVPESVVLANGLAAEERNAYTWSKDAPYTAVYAWNSPYERIFYCNVVLDGLQRVHITTQKEAEQFNRVKGNALFHRAWNYYSLAQIYAPLFDAHTAKEELGLPLRMSSDLNVKTERSSLNATYDLIIRDLTQAATLLPSQPQFKTRGSKTSAFALLSKTYLVMSDYKSAEKYADSALMLNNVLLDYNNLDSTAPYVGIFNPEVIFHCRTLNYRSLSRSCYIDSSLYNSYSANDLRRSIFFMRSTDGIIFKGRYDEISTRQFMGIASDELYLIKAECYARNGDTDKASQFLNKLLLYRFRKGTYAPISGKSSAEILESVILERKKELVMRGVRWSDMRRLSGNPGLTETVTRRIGYRTYILEPNSYRYTFPIPDDVIAKTGIQQNSKW
ncbi:MAG: RagB/SusD family nutrient uptake outer membrane protein [Chitinophagaceae bacterium]|nr:MAG: RagB/SusD family nutrient uptake outer membrane protein [Chitinophagaceae bacterium]